jgi:hypothetical protein
VGLAPLAEMRELRYLKIVGTAEQLRTLPTLGTVTALDLSEMAPTDEDIRRVLDLPALTELDVSCSGMTGAGVRLLTGLPRLTALSLRRPPAEKSWESKNWEPLLEFMRLKKLSIEAHDYSFGDAELAYLVDLSALEELSIIHGDFRGSSGMWQLTKLKSLRKLHLDRPGFVPTWGLDHLVKIKTLTDLSIHAPLNYPHSSGYKPFRQFKHLTRLALTDCPLEDGDLEHLYGLTNLTELRVAPMFGAWFSPESVQRLRTALPGCAFGQ